MQSAWPFIRRGWKNARRAVSGLERQGVAFHRATGMASTQFGEVVWADNL